MGLERTYCEELARRLKLDPTVVIEMWSERAAVLEYEGGHARSKAELLAFNDIERELSQQK